MMGLIQLQYWTVSSFPTHSPDTWIYIVPLRMLLIVNGFLSVTVSSKSCSFLCRESCTFTDHGDNFKDAEDVSCLLTECRRSEATQPRSSKLAEEAPLSPISALVQEDVFEGVVEEHEGVTRPQGGARGARQEAATLTGQWGSACSWVGLLQ